MPMDPKELDTRFTYHSPNDEQQVKYVTIRAEAKDLAAIIEVECPDSREKSLAMTNLEQAVMWANAAIARRS